MATRSDQPVERSERRPGQARTRFERYVAIGDSSTEGLDDPDGNGGYRGWADRLAERIARDRGSLLYANLGVRGRTTRAIREHQLGPALEMRPDLVSLFSGTNDVVSRRFDLAEVAADVEHMHRALIGGGATLVTFTLPDLTAVMPLGRLVAARVEALNEALRAIARRTGAVLLDFAEHPVASDPRLWSDDGIHANSAGHARMAQALAHALGVAGADDTWSEALPEMPRRSPAARLRVQAAWLGRHFLPWVWRLLRGRSTGDGVRAKRPELAPIAPSTDPERC